MKLNFGINDFSNKFNIDNYDNELDEPQLENKPNLYLKNYINKNKNHRKKKIGAKNNSKSKSKNKLEKKNKNTNNDNDSMNIKKIDNYSTSINKRNKSTLKMKNKIKNKKIISDDDDFINMSNQKNYKLNKTLNNNYHARKDEDNENIDKNISNKTFEQKCQNIPFKKKEKENENEKEISMGQEHDNSLDNLIIDNKYNKEKIIIDNNNFYDNFNDVIEISPDYNSLNYNSEMNKSKSVDRKNNINNYINGNLISLQPKPWAYSYYNRDNNQNDIMLKIKKKRPVMNNIQRQEFFNNLYNDGKKRKEKYKKLSMEKEAKFNTIYTFTPKTMNNRINEKYLKNMADSKFSVTNTNATTFYNITNNNNNGMNNTSLITTTNNNYSLLNNIKYESNRNVLGVVMEENKGEFPLDFMSRLAAYEKIKKSNLEKIKNEVDISMKGNNIYKNKPKSSFNRIPFNNIINNSENYFENKQKNLEKIVQTMYEEQGITFQPRTNKSFNGKIKNDIIERNKEFIKDKQKKLEKYSNLKEKECTFMPKINTISTMTILNNSKTGQQSNVSYKTEQGNSNVSKRLFDYQNKYKEKLEDIRSKYKESYSFKPEISKNTDDILNNKKKMMEQIKENENNLINNIQEGNEYEVNYHNKMNNNNNVSNYNKIIKNNNRNNDLLMKQMKLGELEEISKRISELSEENMIYTEEKMSSQKKMKEKRNNKAKLINENNQIVFNEHNNSIESNNFQINPNVKSNNANRNNLSKINHISNENSEQILELAKNLLNEDLLKQKQLLNGNDNFDYYNNKKKESTNDFGSIMMYNNINNNMYNTNNNSKMSYSKKKNNAQEYDYDYIKGNKRIMNLNYYDNLL